MYGKELNERNPLRLFEHSIHGGLGRGNIGIVVARRGLGKTAFLVGIALDDAMRGRKVLHVSLDKTVDHLREFYDEIFMDLAHSAHLEDLSAERLEMGSVHINETSNSRVDLMPYSGAKASCVGREVPRYAIEEMTERKLLVVHDGE